MNGRVNWYYDDFITRIDGVYFRIIAESDYISGFTAQAYIPSYTSVDKFCNEASSTVSIEDAILNLVKKIEQTNI